MKNIRRKLEKGKTALFMINASPEVRQQLRLPAFWFVPGQRDAGAEALPLFAPRMALKNSDEGSTTITSLFLLKLDL